MITGSSTVDPTSHSPNPSVYSPLTSPAVPHKWTFVAAVYNAKIEKASIYVDGEVSKNTYESNACDMI